MMFQFDLIRIRRAVNTARGRKLTVALILYFRNPNAHTPLDAYGIAWFRPCDGAWLADGTAARRDYFDAWRALGK